MLVVVALDWDHQILQNVSWVIRSLLDIVGLLATYGRFGVQGVFHAKLVLSANIRLEFSAFEINRVQLFNSTMDSKSSS